MIPEYPFRVCERLIIRIFILLNKSKAVWYMDVDSFEVKTDCSFDVVDFVKRLEVCLANYLILIIVREITSLS